jgi:hypothetical protein
VIVALARGLWLAQPTADSAASPIEKSRTRRKHRACSFTVDLSSGVAPRETRLGAAAIR